jgi:hypothetical protein
MGFDGWSRSAVTLFEWPPGPWPIVESRSKAGADAEWIWIEEFSTVK